MRHLDSCQSGKTEMRHPNEIKFSDQRRIPSQGGKILRKFYKIIDQV